MKLSVIVATKDRPALLADCLASLGAQEGADFEVVVVDDGSDAELAPVVERAAESGLAVRYVRQEHAGLSAARNRGAEAAAGDVLAWLDDDGLAAPEWAAAWLDAFARTGCDAVAGKIDLLFEGPRPRWLSPGLRSYLGELDLGADPVSVADPAVPNGGNSAVTRAGFEAAGGFPAHLGHRGDSLAGNEEVAFFTRLVETGGRIVYWPEASMRHRVPETRLRPDFFRRRAFAQGLSDIAVENGSAGAATREVRLAARVVPIFLRGLVRDRSSVGARMWVGYLRGRRAGRRGTTEEPAA